MTQQNLEQQIPWTLKRSVTKILGIDFAFARFNSAFVAYSNIAKITLRYFYADPKDYAKAQVNKSRLSSNANYNIRKNIFQWFNLFNLPLAVLSFIELNCYRLLDFGRSDEGMQRSIATRFLRIPAKYIVAGVFGIVKAPFRGLRLCVNTVCKLLLGLEQSLVRKLKKQKKDAVKNTNTKANPQQNAACLALRRWDHAQSRGAQKETENADHPQSIEWHTQTHDNNNDQVDRVVTNDSLKDLANALSQHGMIEEITAKEMANSAFGRGCVSHQSKRF